MWQAGPVEDLVGVVLDSFLEKTGGKTLVSCDTEPVTNGKEHRN